MARDLSFEHEVHLTDAYFLAAERSFGEEDKQLIKDFLKMAKTFEARFATTGLKKKVLADRLNISIITLWRRFQKQNWNNKDEVITLLQILHGKVI